MALTPKRGLIAVEWAMMAYVLFTTIFIMVTFSRLAHPWQMLAFRTGAVALTLALWMLYRHRPGRFTMLLRVAGQMVLLSWWYPDTYEINRIFPNLDHVFAGWEQSLFGFQPALEFCQTYTHPIISELLSMGYVSYYPLFVGVAVFYYLYRYEQFGRTAFIIVGSFFLFYVVFIFLPVAGPQFYFRAVGTDQIAQGIFPNIGDYFNRIQFDVYNHDFILPIAAFPSSHVGVAVIVMWLALEARNKKLFFTCLPFVVLLFFATFYIQAHYAIDAIAGLFFGTAFYFLLRWLYDRFFSKEFRSFGV